MELDLDALADELKLSQKERLFVKYYMGEFNYNATRAYKKVHVDTKIDSCRANAARTLAKDNVKEYVKRVKAFLDQNILENLNITRHRIVQEYANMAFANIDDYKDDWDKFKEWDEVERSAKAAISEVSVYKTTINNKGSDSDTEISKETIKFKLHSKINALEKLEEFEREANSSGNTEKPINVNVTFSTQEEEQEEEDDLEE